MSRAKDVAIIVLLVAVAYLLVTRDQIDSVEHVSRDSSIAVLPFVSRGADPEKEDLSDRVWDDTITQLAWNSELRVLSRSSMSAYRSTDQTVESVGAELGVEFIVEGAVRTTQEGVQVLAQLIRIHDGAHLWHETYEVTGEGVDSVPSEIAESVAREIGTSQ